VDKSRRMGEHGHRDGRLLRKGGWLRREEWVATSRGLGG
jgi:hypothetical protein